MSREAPQLAVNVALIDADERMLLTRREDFGVWCLPGGAVDAGESLAEAAVREVREETGQEVRLTRLVGLYSRPNLGGYHTLALFAASAVGDSLNLDPREVIEAAWFARDMLPDDLLWGQRERIEDAFDGVGGSVVRTIDLERPPFWPNSRTEHYAKRDASGLPRAEYYRRFAARLGDDTSRIEISGAPHSVGDA